MLVEFVLSLSTLNSSLWNVLQSSFFDIFSQFMSSIHMALVKIRLVFPESFDIQLLLKMLNLQANLLIINNKAA